MLLVPPPVPLPCILVTFPVVVINTQQKPLQEEGLIWAHSLRMQSAMAGSPWWWVLELVVPAYLQLGNRK